MCNRPVEPLLHYESSQLFDAEDLAGSKRIEHEAGAKPNANECFIVCVCVISCTGLQIS